VPQRFSDIMVDVEKLREYCLSEAHLHGRHKARVFRSRLGLTAADAEVLRKALLVAARNSEHNLRAINADEFGQRYVLDFPMTTTSSTAIVRSGWIVRVGEDVLRLTSCYVLVGERS
jgi:hypothetical protein